MVETALTLAPVWLLHPHPQELIVKIPLKEIQSTWTQQPTANSSYPYVELSLGDVAVQRTMQLQLEQVSPVLPVRPCHSVLAFSFYTLGSSPACALPQGANRPTQGTAVAIYHGTDIKSQHPQKVDRRILSSRSSSATKASLG